MIAFLHTTKVLVQRFDELVRKYDQETNIKHYINEELLDSALFNGKTDTVTFENEIEKIKKDKPSILICTCSTYGQECDSRNDIERIDKPIVEYLVSNYTKIGLVYTANSTKEVSENLIIKIASEQNKKIEVTNCDCSEFWAFFEQGNLHEYEKGIADKIKLMESNVDVIFLAQASMEGAKKFLTDIEKEVFSSPEYGIRFLLTNNETI